MNPALDKVGFRDLEISGDSMQRCLCAFWVVTALQTRLWDRSALPWVKICPLDGKLATEWEGMSASCLH